MSFFENAFFSAYFNISFFRTTKSMVLSALTYPFFNNFFSLVFRTILFSSRIFTRSGNLIFYRSRFRNSLWISYFCLAKISAMIFSKFMKSEDVLSTFIEISSFSSSGVSIPEAGLLSHSIKSSRL